MSVERIEAQLIVTILTLEAPNFDRLIAGDQHAIKVYLGFAIFVALLGIAIVLAGLILPTTAGEGIQGLALKLGGGFVSSLSAFPLKEYLARRDRIHGVQTIREMWKQLRSQPSPQEEDLDRLEELVWKLFEKRAVG
ncbi:MAG: hypothetical protein GY796_22000 [Chloroflexi bacterium]|nr:hypothetical protein [Chloroflexota bacterium]